MNKNRVSILGLMSGTSLDGIDLAYVTFQKGKYQNFEMVFAETIPYPEKWREILQNALHFEAEKLKALSVSYGDYLGDEINRFVKKYHINNIDFIASHGHTILHQPEKGITLQIGDGQTIVNKTQQKVVCDFRTQDVALGGQGAPLVPIGDELLFAEYDYCMN
uniref:anhydro-N-acetylmuramic acid kinase n=1 Tax=Polaribacter sp. TaxID=1920175 RepID=UPI0040489234